MRRLSTVLLVLGALGLVWVAATLTGHEPVTGAIAGLQQRSLRIELRKAPRSSRRLPAAGHALGRIVIPRIGLDRVFVRGDAAGDLRKGPGLIDGTKPPPARVTAIAGHRTTFGAPFFRLDRLRAGDEVRLVMPWGTFRYEVAQVRVVDPSATEILKRRQGTLLLTTCHPVYSARWRLVVIARPYSGR
jgi:sortase A